MKKRLAPESVRARAARLVRLFGPLIAVASRRVLIAMTLLLLGHRPAPPLDEL